jgi:hypothetical protein
LPASSLADGRTDAFLRVLRELGKKWLKDHGVDAEWIRQLLKQQMNHYVLKRDKNFQKLRKKMNNAEYSLQVMSLLISYGDVGPQSFHIDMIYPHYQAVLFLTEGPVTEVCPPQNVFRFNPEEGLTEEALVDLLTRRLARVPDRVSQRLLSVLKDVATSHPEETAFLKQYGLVMAPLEVIQSAKISYLPEGQEFAGYGGFEGSGVHRGPACSKNRFVLFASYSPEAHEPYDPDVQYSAVTFMSDLIRTLSLRGLKDAEVLRFLYTILIQAVATDFKSMEAINQIDSLDDDDEGDALSMCARACIAGPHHLAADSSRAGSTADLQSKFADFLERSKQGNYML